MPKDQVNLTDAAARIMPVAAAGSSNAQLDALPAALGGVQDLLADAGYFSAGNVQACAAAGIDPLIATGRQSHHEPLAKRFAPAPPAPVDPTPVEAMAHRLKTPAGETLYALRKQTPEPVLGIIKSVLGGFHQFSLRELDQVRGEWRLVTMAWNAKVAVRPERRHLRALSPNILNRLSHL